MADETPKMQPQVPENVGKFLIEPLNYAIASGVRKALDSGAPVNSVLEMHLNHLASVVAMIKPVEARQAMLADVIRAIPRLTSQHVNARNTTPGGIKLPESLP